MASKVVWSPEALEDVEAIARYIARDSPHYAATVVEKILATVKIFEAFPHVGRVVPELGDPAILECFAYSYRIVYRVSLDSVMIVTVIHGKRLLDPLP